jgi:hypothetical protein
VKEIPRFATCTITRSISFASALLAAIVALAVSGCGDSAKDRASKADCILRMENRATVNAVRKAFNEGKLGTADQLASNEFFRQDKRKNFLDANGHLLSYDRLMQTTDVSYDVLGWVNTLERPAAVAAARTAARERARARALKQC